MGKTQGIMILCTFFSLVNSYVLWYQIRSCSLCLFADEDCISRSSQLVISVILSNSTAQSRGKMIIIL